MGTAPAGSVIGIVGPCSAGKSTLARGLVERGLPARALAQEHSFAPRMWRQIGQAAVLVYLDVSFAVAQRRRWLDWRPEDLEEQHRRLADARQHADFYLDTDSLTVEEVRERVLAFLETAPNRPR
jgi:cytidylate kinase